MKIKIEEQASPLILTFETDSEMCAIRWAIEVCKKEYPNSVFADQIYMFDREITSFYKNRRK